MDRVSDRISDEDDATAPDRIGVSESKRAPSLLVELVSAAADFRLNVHRGRIFLNLGHQSYLRRGSDRLICGVAIAGSFSSSHIGILLTDTKVQQ
ncbi:MAG: hypothetical protein DMG86_20710 [Acidobacteria bacterium]|nr:MAG: hypothetical protein DMG86_20710 [Acidobacteriota bacterium]